MFYSLVEAGWFSHESIFQNWIAEKSGSALDPGISMNYPKIAWVKIANALFCPTCFAQPRRSWIPSLNTARFCKSRANCCVSVCTCHRRLPRPRPLSGCSLAASRDSCWWVPTPHSLSFGRLLSDRSSVVSWHINHLKLSESQLPDEFTAGQS